MNVAGEIIGHFIPNLSPATKFEKHIARLRDEAWFSELEQDYRYEYILYQNKKIKLFLSSEKNIKMITSMDVEKERFINLVKKEHDRFTSLR
ncbi:hypothetical protein [Bacillus canaveralius]|uniref:hypothetical protein n=1 Tax=Bacillus canaveralius TaxID=1403243 RepID=UPI000F776E4C|nr:hypothetical protein [Bacillus canaveralius]RSK55636.1 hypothetical protein EJA13_03115 [Bacillus canaveralius]